MGDQDDRRELLHNAAALPAVNTLLRVLLGGARGGGEALAEALTRVAQGQAPDAGARVSDGFADLPTRVEDLIPAQRRGERPYVVVSAPRYAGDVEGPRQGVSCALVWATQRGVVELPTRYRDTQTLDQGLRVWLLEVDGPAVRVQRRAFVRVPLSVPVTVRTSRLDAAVPPPAAAASADAPGASGAREGDPAAPPELLDGRTLDLSEGGLRCVLPAPALPPDLPVDVAFAVNGDQFRLKAAIVRAVPGRAGARGPSGTFETAIRFVEPGSRGDDLRRLVFAEQLRLRRSGLD
ncbi:MAG: PilZ domain-containing protein [Kineosporiaceae bacterium]